MAIKSTGTSLDYIIHPGEIIADMLNDRGITQSELAKRTGVSEPFISGILSGDKRISAHFAMALEYALSVPKSFWLNLQANYDAEILAFQEVQSITSEERTVISDLKEIVKYLRKIGKIPVGQKADEVILSLRKTLQVSNLNNLGNLTPAGVFRMSRKDATNKYVLGAWLQMCKIIAAANTVVTTFERNKINALIAEIKTIMVDTTVNPQIALPAVLSKYGIGFSIVQNFKGAPVHGYICSKQDEIYQVTLTIRGAFADIFWFSLFHELGHIVNGDVGNNSFYMDVDNEIASECEKRADQFAADALLDPSAYESFVRNRDFSFHAISSFAASQKVPPYIVIGRLQKEAHIPYQWYTQHKLRYKWQS